MSFVRIGDRVVNLLSISQAKLLRKTGKVRITLIGEANHVWLEGNDAALLWSTLTAMSRDLAQMQTQASRQQYAAAMVSVE